MRFLNAIKNFIMKYKHGWILSYFFVYLFWFTYLEQAVTTKFNVVYSKLDNLIPFQEVFIIPYFLWFAYIAVTVAYFLLTSKQDFYKCCAFLFLGMTICLIIYTIWPNGHYLRVNLSTLGRSNIFIDMLATIYSIDTATNVFPSIHVLNSVGAMIAINKSEKLHNIVWLQWSAFILTVAICLSTVFLKQHSVLDIFGALALSVVLYAIVYAPGRFGVSTKVKQELSKNPGI
jgi:membrane-associated phospholipid phosphatase